MALTLSLSDGANIYSLTGLTATLLDGNYFGLLELFGTAPDNDSSLQIDYRNFSVIAIPEPSTLALLGGGVVLLAFLRRRKS